MIITTNNECNEVKMKVVVLVVLELLHMLVKLVVFLTGTNTHKSSLKF